jgi:hypothetical protein
LAKPTARNGAQLSNLDGLRCCCALEHLETVFANRTRYGSGIIEADCDKIISSIRAKLDVVEEAFRRGTGRHNTRH